MQKKSLLWFINGYVRFKRSLVVLADTIKWSKFEDEFVQYYSKGKTS